MSGANMTLFKWNDPLAKFGILPTDPKKVQEQFRQAIHDPCQAELDRLSKIQAEDRDDFAGGVSSLDWDDYDD